MARRGVAVAGCNVVCDTAIAVELQFSVAHNNRLYNIKYWTENVGAVLSPATICRVCTLSQNPSLVDSRVVCAHYICILLNLSAKSY